MALKVTYSLFNVRNELTKDPMGTIEKLAEIGYRYLEIANLDAKRDYGTGFGVDAEKLRAKTEKLGVSFVAAHVDPLDDRNIDNVLAYHKTLGTPCIISKLILSGRTRPETIEDCERLNENGEKCVKKGFTHGIHSPIHGTVGDKSDLDLVIEKTVPELVGIDYDTYWALRGGADVVKYIKRYGERIIMIDMKDLPKGMTAPVNFFPHLPPGMAPRNAFIDHPELGLVTRDHFTEIGTGTMDLQSMIDATNQYTKATSVILEQDYSQHPPLESAKITYDAFHKFNGVEWS